MQSTDASCKLKKIINIIILEKVHFFFSFYEQVFII